MDTKEKCNQCELELTDDCPRYGGAVSCQEAEDVVFKGMGYNMVTYKMYSVPECPRCTSIVDISEEDIGKAIERKHCHTRLAVPSEGWIWKYLDDKGKGEI